MLAIQVSSLLSPGPSHIYLIISLTQIILGPAYYIQLIIGLARPVK